MTIIVHNNCKFGHRSYAYKDDLPHPGPFPFQCEGYVCGDPCYPPHYPVPSTILATYEWGYPAFYTSRREHHD